MRYSNHTKNHTEGDKMATRNIMPWNKLPPVTACWWKMPRNYCAFWLILSRELLIPLIHTTIGKRGRLANTKRNFHDSIARITANVEAEAQIIRALTKTELEGKTANAGKLILGGSNRNLQLLILVSFYFCNKLSPPTHHWMAPRTYFLIIVDIVGQILMQSVKLLIFRIIVFSHNTLGEEFFSLREKRPLKVFSGTYNTH